MRLCLNILEKVMKTNHELFGRPWTCLNLCDKYKCSRPFSDCESLFNVVVFCWSARIMLILKVEPWVSYKLLVNLNKTPTECFQMIPKAYGEDCMSHTHVWMVQKWTTSDQKITDCLRRPPKLSVQMIAEDKRHSI